MVRLSMNLFFVSQLNENHPQQIINIIMHVGLDLMPLHNLKY